MPFLRPMHLLLVMASILLLAACGDSSGGGDDDDGDNNPPPTENNAPTADAGPDQSLTDTGTLGIEAVVLDGSGSSDSDGTIQSWQWDDGSGNTATGETASVSLAPGLYSFVLTVTDDDSATDSDTVRITITNASGNIPPRADAGDDISVADADGDDEVTVMLDGSGSEDADGTISSYAWTDGGIYSSTEVSPTFDLAVGSYNFSLTVTDDAGDTHTDSVVVEVTGDVPPTADAGADDTITLGETVSLDGSGSSDNGTIASYDWTYDGSSIGTTEMLDWTPTETGTLTVTLEVTDNAGLTGSDSVLITVNEPGGGGDTDPTIGGDSDLGTQEGPTVTVQPNASDPDGDPLTFDWSFKSGPEINGQPVSFSMGHIDAKDDEGTTDIPFPTEGEYTITLTVTDDDGNSVTKDFTVTLDNPDDFSISGSVEDTEEGSTDPVTGKNITLEWTLLPSGGDQGILINVTDGSGNFTFDQLIGSVEDFQVLVPGGK